MASHAKKPRTNLLANLITGIGIGLVVLSVFIMVRLFHDPVKQEIKYVVNSVKKNEELLPPNTKFAITIDKIGASASIIQDVDPINSSVYQLALKDGVAHAKGTKLPGDGGNIFLFAHSSADLLTAERYNSVFYLMHHLEIGDQIRVWKDDNEYGYAVSDKILVAPSESHYLTDKSDSEQLTLMTCWPPGTTLKRLIIIAKSIPIAI